MKLKYIIVLFLLMAMMPGCKPNHSAINDQTEDGNELEMWLTTTDQKNLFQKQLINASEPIETPSALVISIDSSIQFQPIDGFGFTLTGGSARLIHSMSEIAQTELLQQLFSTSDENIGISYLRISVGASDLSDSVFTYNDLPLGETDVELLQFSLAPELVHLIPVLKKIKSISPEVQIMGSPWSAPAWMKDNESLRGGSLRKEFFGVYANYLAKYVKAMEAQGLKIDALTIQNEPLHPGNNPSMFMSAQDQALFVKNNLGPVFEKEGIGTKIIIYDHNADRIDYPISILNDADARKYIDGSAFHLYGGEVNDISIVHEAHPDKNLYFTEQWIGGPANFEGDFTWHIENLMIGATRNWCRTVLEWNLAADPDYEPHTDQGGCTRCLGAITIDGDEVEMNPAYYIVAHASKFVRPGTVRIHSDWVPELPNVAFKTPNGEVVFIVLNKAKNRIAFQLKTGSRLFQTELETGAAATYIIRSNTDN